MIIDNKEYDNAFPFDREYIDWINHMENDLATGKLIVTNHTKIVLHKDDTEEFSPYSTVNS